jgi:hypothetical protein
MAVEWEAVGLPLLPKLHLPPLLPEIKQFVGQQLQLWRRGIRQALNRLILKERLATYSKMVLGDTKTLVNRRQLLRHGKRAIP